MANSERLIERQRGRRSVSASVPFGGRGPGQTGTGSAITPGPSNSGVVGIGIVGIMVVGEDFA